ncbi:UNVERIFIED_CONTAM: hypothetical protein Sindi_1655000, partial [Sesamum indicum]
NVWQYDIVCVLMYAVTRKFKALKPVFQQQRRNKGDLSLNVQLAKGFLGTAQSLVSSDRQNGLLLHLEHCCWLVYAKAIAQRHTSRRILQINNKHGTTYSEPEVVINEFVSFYQTLLSGDKRRQMIGIRYLRPWVRHVLTEEETLELLQPVTAANVKQAIFYITEDKAPGLNRFSSDFYKAAWPIVGIEVMKAILDFFNMGKLLNQVNATLFALIPNLHSPLLVADFRPRSCRSIGDNVLLAQELFAGYNQQHLPPRCALNVDIRKA